MSAKRILSNSSDKVDNSYNSNNSDISVRTLILDPGGYEFRLGLSDDGVPTQILKAIVGFPPLNGYSQPEIKEDNPILFAEDALNKRYKDNQYYRLYHPIEWRVVHDFDSFVLLLKHMLDLMEINDYEKYNILILESHVNPQYLRKELYNFVQNEFGFHKLGFISNQLAALEYFNVKTGVVVDTGHFSSFILPCYEGYGINSSLLKLDLSGTKIHTYLKRLIAQQLYHSDKKEEIMQTMTPMKIEEIKHKFCKVNQYGGKSPQYSEKEVFDTGLGVNIDLSEISTKTMEIFFKNVLPGLFEGHTLTDGIIQSIKSSDPEFHKEILQNILLCGGNATYPNLAGRLKKEIGIILEKSGKQEFAQLIEILTDPEPSLIAWKGAKKMIKNDDEKILWIEK